MLRPLFVVLIVAALLTPVIFRRQRRRAGLEAGHLTPRFRRRLFATMGLSAALLVVGLTGVAFADNGDATGTKTGISKDQVTKVVPEGKTRDETVSTLRTTQAKDHLAINYTWLMTGGVLVLFMQAGFALVETGFTRAKNAAHTMMMNLSSSRWGPLVGLCVGTRSCSVRYRTRRWGSPRLEAAPTSVTGR